MGLQGTLLLFLHRLQVHPGSCPLHLLFLEDGMLIYLSWTGHLLHLFHVSHYMLIQCAFLFASKTILACNSRRHIKYDLFIQIILYAFLIEIVI